METAAAPAVFPTSDFVYVDTAFGAVNLRNHVQRLSDIDFHNEGQERYISHRRGTIALVDWLHTHTNQRGFPTIEGFDGPVWDPSLPFDFDHRLDPSMALLWLRQYLDRLEQHEVPLDALRIYYSGYKGFHLEIPHTLFGGFEPSAELNVWERTTALELMKDIPFDTAVYDKLRLWRLPNTLNSKGQRYKIRLALNEVRGLSMREIEDLATTPRHWTTPTAPDEDWNANDYLVDVWDRACGRTVELQKTTIEVPKTTKEWSESRYNRVTIAAITAAIADSWPLLDPTVSRHSDYLLPLSGVLTRYMGAEVAAEVLKDAVRASGDESFFNDRSRHWEEEIDRLTKGSAEKIEKGQPIEGLPTVAQHWPELASFLGDVLIIPSDAGKNTRSSSRVSGLTFTSLEELLAEPPEDTAYLVEGMLPSGGISLWGAKPKVGKSVAIRNLAMCVATGEPFLGRAVYQGTVLILALEEKRAEVANHFRRMGGMDENIHLHVGAAPESSRDGLAALQAAITLYQPTLVIADPVFKLVRVRDSSDYAELTKALEPVIELARNNNVHVATTHHLGKMVREGGDDVLGSTAIFGAVDTLVVVRRRQDNARVIQTIQRYGADLPEMMLPMDDTTGKIILGEELSEARKTEARWAVLNLFSKLKSDETLTQKGVREQAGIDSARSYKALLELVESGRVERSGAGTRKDPYQYRLAALSTPENPPEDSSIVVLQLVTEKQESTKNQVEATSEGPEPETPAAPTCAGCGKALIEAEVNAGWDRCWDCQEATEDDDTSSQEGEL